MRRTHLASFVLTCLFAPLLPDDAAAAEGGADQELRFDIKRMSKRLTSDHKVPGIAVALIRSGEVKWIEGIGVADLQSNEPVTSNTIFNVGSISKSVASWGFMRLVEKGQVKLDRPIEDYLIRWKLPASDFDSNEVTLRRMLSHTAGISLSGYSGFVDGDSVPSLVQSLAGDTAGAGDVRISHRPGSRYQYSGGGYTIAQLMLEDVTGDKFAEYMTRNVLDP